MTLDFLAAYGPQMLAGLVESLTVSAAGLALAMAIGITCGSLRYSRRRLPSLVVAIYVNLFRCTPLLVQIFMIFFALPEVGLRFSPFATGVIALGLWGGAYLTEDVRSGLEAVSSREILAARALGMSALASFLDITLPLGLRYSLPSIGTTALNLFRSSSFMIVISYSELTYVANRISAETFEIFRVFGTAALLYLGSSLVLGRAFRLVERMTAVPGLGRAAA